MEKDLDIEDGLTDATKLLFNSDTQHESRPQLYRDENRKGRLNRYSRCLLIIAIAFAIIFPLAGVIIVKSRPVSSLNHHGHSKGCHDPMLRQEWRSMPVHRRHSYITAVKRLATKPSRLGLNTSLYDDFTYVHVKLKYQVHHVAMSLPWHRYFLNIYEDALRTEGGWDGYMPYWDWTLDSSSPSKSPIWNSWAGFGGDGTSPDGCVADGPLASFNASYKDDAYSPHCVKRKFHNDSNAGEMHGTKYSAEIVQSIIKESKSFNEFRERIENGPHRHLHLGIGGAMNGIESSNDPLFYVHHAQIDRLWWLWQQENPGIRGHEYFGPVGFSNSTISESGADIDEHLSMLGLAADKSVHELMTTRSEVLCYRYSKDF